MIEILILAVLCWVEIFPASTWPGKLALFATLIPSGVAISSTVIQLPPAGTISVTNLENSGYGGCVLDTTSKPYECGDNGKSGTYIQFTVNSPIASQYSVSLEYANGYHYSESIALSVNGASVTNYPLASTTSWNVYRSSPAQIISLSSGISTLRFSQIGAWDAYNFAGIELTAQEICSPSSLESCTVPNGTGTATCNSYGSAWGSCTPTACNPGFNLQNGVCVVDVCEPGSTQSCSLAGLPGIQTCNATGSAWMACAGMYACNSSVGVTEPLQTCSGALPCTLPLASQSSVPITASEPTPLCRTTAAKSVLFDDGGPQSLADSQGLVRDYCYYQASSKPMPLVIYFHGAGGSADDLYNLTSLREKATSYGIAISGQPGFSLVSVQGRNLHWPIADSDGSYFDFYHRDLSVPSTNDDVSFVDQLIDLLVKSGGADPNQLYVAGTGTGAQFAQLYAFARHETQTPGGNRVAAFAGYSGADPFNNLSAAQTPSCQLATYPQSQVPIFMMSRDCDLVTCNSNQYQQLLGAPLLPGSEADAWASDAFASGGDQNVQWRLITGANTPTGVGHNTNACLAGSQCSISTAIINHQNWPDGVADGSAIDHEPEMLLFMRNHPLALVSPTTSLASQISAAQTTARTASVCTALGRAGFYWEIGNETQALASGSVGTTYVATSEMGIASATKWVTGTYAVQTTGGFPSSAPLPALDSSAEVATSTLQDVEFVSGYDLMPDGACGGKNQTVQQCFDATPAGSTVPNNTFDPSSLGMFSYGSGHDQKLGVDSGLGDSNAAQLSALFQSVLGPGITFNFTGVTLAGGITSSPSQYAVFLQRILSGDLQIRNFLGMNAVCTDPSLCDTAVSSPLGTPNASAPAHYSLNHWVEDDTTYWNGTSYSPYIGDGSFSSPGKNGFYPWISSDKSLYGIVARDDSTDANAWAATLQCGRAIRKAWYTGVPQP